MMILPTIKNNADKNDDTSDHQRYFQPSRMILPTIYDTSNHVRKKIPHKRTTKDDITITFHPSTQKPSSIFSTIIGDARNKDTRDMGSQVMLIQSTPSLPTMTSTPNRGSPESGSECLSTPSKRKKRSTVADRNKCRKCQLQYGSKMDNDFNSIWINCDQITCDYWVHLACLGFMVGQDEEESFTVMAKFVCPAHIPKHQAAKRSILQQNC